MKDMAAELPLYKYVDDTSLFEVCERNSRSNKLQSSAEQIVQWCDRNKMAINEKKTKEMIINFAKNMIPSLI